MKTPTQVTCLTLLVALAACDGGPSIFSRPDPGLADSGPDEASIGGHEPTHDGGKRLSEAGQVPEASDSSDALADTVGTDGGSDAPADGRLDGPTEASDAGTPLTCSGSEVGDVIKGINDFSWAFTYDPGAQRACANACEADVGACPADQCQPCFLNPGSDTPQCPITFAQWTFQLDPVTSVVYISAEDAGDGTFVNWTAACQ